MGQSRDVLVLALESATELAGVALTDGEGVLASATTSRGRRHAESITPAVEFVCERTGISVGDVDGICVDVGPGLFTGLRVGVATAKALAFALELPVAAVTSLEVIARALCATVAGDQASGALLVPVVDAKRGEVFSALYRTRRKGPGDGEKSRGSVELVGGARLSSPDELAGSLSALDESFHLGGDGAIRYSESLASTERAVLATGAPSSPPVEVLAEIGFEKLSSGMGIDGDRVEPLYLRDADVRINWEQRVPARGEPSQAVSGG